MYRLDLEHRGRYSTEVGYRYGSDVALLDGLSKYYAFDEASGNRLPTVGSGTWTVIAGSVGSGVGVNGDAASVSANNVLGIAGNVLLSVPFTIACWIKPSAFQKVISDGPIIVSTSSASAFDIVQLQANTNIQYLVYPSGGSATLVGNPLSTGAWHLLVAWYRNGSGGGIQIDNGTPATTASGTCSVGSSSIYLSYNNISAGIAGLFDEFYVWNRVLTAAERTALYNGGAGLYYPF